MGPYGFLWVLMGPYGFPWVLMGPYGYLWVIMGLYGSSWVLMDLYLFLWVVMCPYGFLWVRVRIRVRDVDGTLATQTLHLLLKCYICNASATFATRDCYIRYLRLLHSLSEYVTDVRIGLKRK